MKKSPFVESSAEPIQLSRAHLPELLKTLEEDGHAPSVTWNAVDALELLVEAGHFRAARGLAEGVRSLVAGTPRERLFGGYVSLCDLMESGHIGACAQSIEAMQAEIEAGGHSTADRARAALLVARALFMGVSLGVLPDEDLLRARATLASEFEECSTPDAKRHKLQLGVELAKTYLYAPKPELLQARLMIEKLEAEAAAGECSPHLALEILRLRYHASHSSGPTDDMAIKAEQLRRQARATSELEEGLAEITIARCKRNISGCAARLQPVLAVFEKCRFNSGTIEALFVIADDALSRGLSVKATGSFRRIIDLAREGGHLQAALIAIHGSFHAALSSGDLDAAQHSRKAMESALDSDLAIGAIGLNAVHAAQIVGDFSGAVQCAERCEKLFRERGLRGPQAQALYFAGSAHAAAGAWARAKKAWKESLVIEESRRAVVAACDRRAALAQAVVMCEFSGRGHVSERTVREAERLLEKSQKGLVRFEGISSATRALCRVLSIRAQLRVLSKDPVSAVSCLDKARGLYEKLGAARDVALTDALSGLALLEVAKGRGGDLFEEAHSMLQRALVYFDAPRHNLIRWKLKYYLATCAYLRSQAKGHGHAGASWREASAAWLRGAMADLESSSSQECTASDSADFSPGLSPEALEPLKRALGFKERPKQRSASSSAEQEKAPEDGGYFH